MNNPLSDLANKEMSRKEFLAIVGLAAVSIVGFGHIVKLLTGRSLDNYRAPWERGTSAYGGSAEK